MGASESRPNYLPPWLSKMMEKRSDLLLKLEYVDRGKRFYYGHLLVRKIAGQSPSLTIEDVYIALGQMVKNTFVATTQRMDVIGLGSDSLSLRAVSRDGLKVIFLDVEYEGGEYISAEIASYVNTKESQMEKEPLELTAWIDSTQSW